MPPAVTHFGFFIPRGDDDGAADGVAREKGRRLICGEGFQRRQTPSTPREYKAQQ
jgi:hypothetical protein